MLDKKAQIQKLSEDILTDFELNQNCFENILHKIKRLARLRDDYDTIIWINLEINGYKDARSIPDLSQRVDKFKYAKKSGRIFYKKDDKTNEEIEKYWISSICELESRIDNARISLEGMQIPQNFTPAITTSANGNSFIQERFSNVLDKISSQKQTYSTIISDNKSLLGKIKSNFYNYVLNIYASSPKFMGELRFRQFTKLVI